MYLRFKKLFNYRQISSSGSVVVLQDINRSNFINPYKYLSMVYIIKNYGIKQLKYQVKYE
jgi:hypothetical protein